MILLDTNIVSEIMRPRPNHQVLDWLNRQYSPDLYVSSVTIAEIMYGLWRLPDGRRKQGLQQRFERFLAKAFQFRVLGFDEPEARVYGRLMGESSLAGRTLSVPDGQIAAIAIHNRFAVATRNTRDFSYCGVQLIDPFDPEE
ncbi:MAG TPA: type II toxin-antitoxin system VapC family toxin [Gammaproteobacteria bacterium]|nr:type II toxin-antitoxin system VapC family toxin [Gammaproteobacteria bacterium]